MRSRAPVWVLAAGLSLWSLPVQADCACLCLEGTFRPVCTSPQALGGNLGICQALTGQGCSSPPPAHPPAAYDPPLDEAQNCRDAQLHDAATDAFVVAKVCDVRAQAAREG